MTTFKEQVGWLCDQYEQMTSEAFMDALARTEGAAIVDEGKLSKHLLDDVYEAQKAWMDEALPELDDRSPSAFVEAMANDAERLSFLDTALTELDEGFPVEWSHRLKPHVAGLLEQVATWAREASALPWQEDDAMEGRMIRSVRATELLGQWGIPVDRSGLLEHYLASAAPPEPWSEAMQSYLQMAEVNASAAILDQLEAYLEAESVSDRPETIDYLLQAITAIGCDRPEERIYQVLRRSFRQTRPRQLVVICLADYGDPRAVTMLRRFLLEEAVMVDETTYYEVIRAIQKLGGDTRDLPDPFSEQRSLR